MAKWNWPGTPGHPESCAAASDPGTQVHLKPICMPQATHLSWNWTSWNLRAGGSQSLSPNRTTKTQEQECSELPKGSSTDSPPLQDP